MKLASRIAYGVAIALGGLVALLVGVLFAHRLFEILFGADATIFLTIACVVLVYWFGLFLAGEVIDQDRNRRKSDDNAPTH
jgi:hypothetical protein